MTVWLQWCTFGHISHYHKRKLKIWLQFTMSFNVMHVNVLMSYPVTICFFIFPGTVQLCSSVYFCAGCTHILALLSVVILVQYALYFNPGNVILLWPVKGWKWAFRVCESNKAVITVITLFHHNTDPPLPVIYVGNIAVQGYVTVCNMSRSWILPVSKNILESETKKRLCWNLTVCNSGFP
jgi:hypothetical protein